MTGVQTCALPIFLIDIAPHVVQVEPSEWKERAARVARRARDVWAMGK